MRSFILAALACASFAASAQLYRWTDEKGRVHITDRPPPASAKNVRQRDAGAGAATTGGELPYSVQLAAKNHPITLFTAPDCGAPCGTARALLNARGVPFREVRVAEDAQRDELRKAIGALAVPSLVVGANTQKGFEESAYHALLDLAGYPRTGILPARNQREPQPKPAAKPPAQAADEGEDSGPATGPYAPR